MRRDSHVPFESLKGKVITELLGLEDGSEVVKFICSDGTEYNMYHDQDCCENVRIIDVVGDINDLIGEPLLLAEESTSNEEQEDIKIGDYDSGTWTFYKLATRKGYVDIRWLGESNGYYSESVDFIEVK
jgi:hypothetical protein